MKIIGAESSEFTNFTQEPGFLGFNDVVLGRKQKIHRYTFSFFATSQGLKTFTPKLHLHIPTNALTTFTGKLREYCLPWRWKSAYLEKKDSQPPHRILICTSVSDGEIPDSLSKIMGKSLFITSLMNSHKYGYDEQFGQEFLRLKKQETKDTTKKIFPFLGERFGTYAEFSTDSLCHIYRPRNLFSTFKYYILRQFSTSWKEVTIHTSYIAEKILIKKADEKAIAKLGLLNKK